MTFTAVDMDQMENETSPGVQSRRYRLVDFNGGQDDTREMATLELIPEPGDNPNLETTRFVESMFLPMTHGERMTFVWVRQEIEEGGQLAREQDVDPAFFVRPYPPLEIEYEVTIRRVTPATKYRPLPRWTEADDAAWQAKKRQAAGTAP